MFYSGSLIDLEHEFVMASLQSSNLYQLDLDEGLSSQKSILSGIGAYVTPYKAATAAST